MDRELSFKPKSNDDVPREQVERKREQTDVFDDPSADEQRRTDRTPPGEKITSAGSSPTGPIEILRDLSNGYPSQVGSCGASLPHVESNRSIATHDEGAAWRLNSVFDRIKLPESQNGFGTQSFRPILLRSASFPVTRRSSPPPETQLISPLKNRVVATTSSNKRSIPTLELHEPPIDTEQIIAMASEKNEAALAAADANRASLTATTLSVKQGEFRKLANLWVKVAEVSSLLQDETNQLRELTRQMELSQSLLESQSEIDIENAPSRKKKLLQDQIDLLRRTIIPHEKRVNFLFRGTSIIDQWIRDFWTNHLIFVTSPSSVADVDDPEMQEKENCYKNGVSILQILAANHSEDEDQESASFFAAVAESEYSNMQHIALENQEKRDEIMERNKSILAFCSTVDSLQEKIKENKDLAKESTQERVTSLYEEAIQWHEQNCLLIMEVVEQLISGNEATSELERRSGVLSELASGAELQAQRIKELEKEEYSLRFTTRIVNEVRGGK